MDTTSCDSPQYGDGRSEVIPLFDGPYKAGLGEREELVSFTCVRFWNPRLGNI